MILLAEMAGSWMGVTSLHIHLWIWWAHAAMICPTDLTEADGDGNLSACNANNGWERGDDFELGSTERIDVRSPCAEVPVRPSGGDLGCLSHAEFEAKFRGRLPVLIDGMTLNWPAVKDNIWHKDRIVARHRNAQVLQTAALVLPLAGKSRK
jgi:hypothetical protein